MTPIIKTDKEIQAMREGGKMLKSVLLLLEKTVEPGMSTKFLADIAKQELKNYGVKPAFLGYYGFPDVICISLNDEVVHGIPSEKRIIQSGDIVSFDFGILHKDMITDGAISVVVGKLDPEVKKLVEKTRESLRAGLNILKDGVQVGSLGARISDVLEEAGLGVVKQFVGHGVGHSLHEAPEIPNYGHKNTGPVLCAGMTIAVEPMATLGGEDVFIDKDGWTVKTKDGSLSAHFEDTILITKTGVEILTSSNKT